MASRSTKSWLCPICGQCEMPYGTTCIDEGCGNEPHISGQFYRRKDHAEDTDKGIGISQISDEGM